jgi:hypothetical protein
VDRAEAAFNLQEFDQSIADCDEAIRLAPPADKKLLWNAYMRRGNSRRVKAATNKEKLDPAIADYTEAIKHLPDNGNGYFWRGFAYTLKGDFKSAERDKNKAKELGYSSAASVPGTFDHLVLNNATRMGDFVQLSPNSEIDTKESYTGPIEITVVARTAKNDIRLHAFNGASVTFNWWSNSDRLYVTRPDGVQGKLQSGSLATAKVRPLDPNKWYALTWRITGEGMQVLVDGKTIFSEFKKNNLSTNRSVTMTSAGSKFDVRSLAVTRLKGKEVP